MGDAVCSSSGRSGSDEVNGDDIACSNSEIASPHPLPIGWATERGLEDRWSTGEPEGSPRPATHRACQAQPGRGATKRLGQAELHYGLPNPVVSFSTTTGRLGAPLRRCQASRVFCLHLQRCRCIIPVEADDVVRFSEEGRERAARRRTRDYARIASVACFADVSQRVGACPLALFSPPRRCRTMPSFSTTMRDTSTAQCRRVTGEFFNGGWRADFLPPPSASRKTSPIRARRAVGRNWPMPRAMPVSRQSDSGAGHRNAAGIAVKGGMMSNATDGETREYRYDRHQFGLRRLGQSNTQRSRACHGYHDKRLWLPDTARCRSVLYANQSRNSALRSTAGTS